MRGRKEDVLVEEVEEWDGREHETHQYIYNWNFSAEMGSGAELPPTTNTLAPIDSCKKGKNEFL